MLKLRKTGSLRLRRLLDSLSPHAAPVAALRASLVPLLAAGATVGGGRGLRVSLQV